MNRFCLWLTAFVLIFAAISPQPVSAQTDPEEAYDPFADYSEFDEASEEEADINFFRNGRFLTVGLAVGPRTFTGGMDKAYGDGPAMGLNLAFFLDLRLALMLGLMTGDHSVRIPTSGPTYTGTVGFNEVNFYLKYYLATQNMIKGFANLNPYIVGGLSQVTRTYSVSELQESSKDTIMSTDAGFGIEIPLLRRKSFIGIQGVYHFANFKDENTRVIDNQVLQNKINGDFINWSFILGMNF